MDQQRLHAAEQRVSPAGGNNSLWQQESKGAQEGLSEAQIQALAASSTREASVASDADMIDKEQMGGEKPVS